MSSQNVLFGYLSHRKNWTNKKPKSSQFHSFRSPLSRTKIIADGTSLSKQIMTRKPYAFVNLIKLPAALTLSERLTSGNGGKLSERMTADFKDSGEFIIYSFTPKAISSFLHRGVHSLAG